MPLENLERLVERRKLSRHQPTGREIRNHLKVAREYAAAARLPGVPEAVRFSNLYDAAHAVSLAGLKLAGYRAPDGEGNRQLTLSCVEQTLALRKGSAAAFAEANRLRSLMQYQGADVDVPDHLWEALSAAVVEGIREIEIRAKDL
ncbi:MAG: hypothetical protein AB7P08_06630 [Burkholderiales bacterium]